jgi:hypothetical protein
MATNVKVIIVGWISKFKSFPMLSCASTYKCLNIGAILTHPLTFCWKNLEHMNERFCSTFITPFVDASFPFLSTHIIIALLRKKCITNDNDPSLNLGRNQWFHSSTMLLLNPPLEVPCIIIQTLNTPTTTQNVLKRCTP